MPLSSANYLKRQPSGVLLALPRAMLSRSHPFGLGLFYDRLERELLALGVSVEKQPLGHRPHEKRGNTNKLIFLHNGARELANVLNTGQAYLDGFWHVDSEGILGMHSGGRLTFDSDEVDGAEAARFCAALRTKFVSNRVSRYQQKKTRTVLPENGIAVFLQGNSPATRRTMVKGSDAMLEAVFQAGGSDPIIVKHHPLKTNESDVASVGALKELGAPIVETDANVHDILRTCKCTVSISSGACFEGFLHHKPAIFFGRSDMRNFASFANDASSFNNAKMCMLENDLDFDRYVFWYLKQHCVELNTPNFVQQILARADLKGFGPERLGIKKELLENTLPKA